MRLIVCAEREDGTSYVEYDGVPPDLKRRDTGQPISRMPAVLLEGQRAGAVLVEPPRYQPASIDFPFDVERLTDLDLDRGSVRWTISSMGPGFDHDFHRTATLDLDVVISGTIHLGLDDGELELGPGDAVIIPGVRHTWRTGEGTVTMSFTMFGLVPTDE